MEVRQQEHATDQETPGKRESNGKRVMDKGTEERGEDREKGTKGGRRAGHSHSHTGADCAPVDPTAPLVLICSKPELS